LLFGGLTLELLLLPGILAPPLSVFGLLWILNGAGQALIVISSSTLLAEHLDACGSMQFFLYIDLLTSSSQCGNLMSVRQ
jgi:hypothetical protein